FGMDRGTPVDRYYIENFLRENKDLIRGNVLEIAESAYSRKFGTDISKYEVLHTKEGRNVTIVGDLTNIATLPENRIDCFICTQTLNFIYDFKAALKGSYFLLKPGGVMLATVAGISQISRYDMDRWGDYWRFTTLSVKKIFEEIFQDEVLVKSYGNALAATAFLQGMAAEELTPEELDHKDEDYQLLITVVAKKKTA
ncbi:MAG: methyltransferase domain-containing protein, partial [Chitinophagaceae bacterium]